jgi:hypothetical protein
MAERVFARALVLTPTVWPGGDSASYVTLAIELPDGGRVIGKPFWIYRKYAGVIDVGCWVPIKVPPDKPDKAVLDEDRVPEIDEVAAVMAEAVGGPAAAPVEPDEWRIALAARYADRVIDAGGISDADAEAIRARIRRGV